ncbi:LppU/SCO3897 family protein [Amycolatopsis taiwanensis]|nr:hypothetical protein [Amycolatopsis taiwanensis]
MLWVRIGAAVVILGLVVAGGIWYFKSSPATAAVGDCLNVKEFSKHADPTKVDCTDPSANVKIAVKLDSSGGSCPQGDYDEYSYSRKSTSYRLCLMPNVVEGDCMADFTSDTAGYQKVACTDPRAEVKVSKVVQGVTDETVCEEFDRYLPVTYSDPKSTYCYTEVSQTTT